MSKEEQLLDAAGDGDLSVVKQLAADTKLDVDWQDHQGFTPFNYACQEGHVSVVSLLLADMRVDVNKPQNDGATPFFMACQNATRKWCHCSWLT